MTLLRVVGAMLLAFLIGKLVGKLKLPEILGWLLAGMTLGPYALGLVNESVLTAEWYETIIGIMECCMGLMIGTELVWKKMRAIGRQIVITTFTQSLGAFFVVTAVFGIVFYITKGPIYLAPLFGGIALATAPAPALSVVREFRTKGPVTDTLIPMAALDDMVAVAVFFTTLSIVSGKISGQSIPVYMILAVLLLPILIGAVVGICGGRLLKKSRPKLQTLLITSSLVLLTWAVGFAVNNFIMPKPILNFMLMGMAFAASFANMVSEERLKEIMAAFSPVLGVGLILVILNLGTPLDYHLILGAGLFTAIYICARAAGKYLGAYFGAAVTHSPKTVKKYLGLTLLPHSGVSLVFTGMAVSALSSSAPAEAKILQGTIAAAAIINEVIAVILAKKGFEWAGEINKAETLD